MPTYISLIRFTQKGIESIKEGPARLDRAKQAFRAAGGELKAFYLIAVSSITRISPRRDRLNFPPPTC